MRALIPLHVSGFWVPFINPSDPLHSGSLGAGITLGSPASVRVREGGECALYLNSKCVEVKLLSSVSEYLGVERTASVEVTAPVGLGEGFGLSAIISIAYALSLLSRSGRGSNLVEAGKAAHYAEVVNLTGLGDVIAEINGGGLVVRLKPGPPGIGETISIPLPHNIAVITIRVGELSTPQMLVKYMDKIVEVGRRVYSEFLRNPSLERFLELSLKFSLETGMMPQTLLGRVEDTLGRWVRRGDVLGYFLKKSLLTAVVTRASVHDVVTSLAETFSKTKIKVLKPLNVGTLVLSHGKS